MEEISVKIVNGISGADCDIDVPTDATIGDVIIGLINEDFLWSELFSTWVLYNMEIEGRITSKVKYNNLNMTVKKYGWRTGKCLVAVLKRIS